MTRLLFSLMLTINAFGADKTRKPANEPPPSGKFGCYLWGQGLQLSQIGIDVSQMCRVDLPFSVSTLSSSYNRFLICCTGLAR